MEHSPPRKKLPIFFLKIKNIDERERIIKQYNDCRTRKQQDEVCVLAKKQYEAELLGTSYISRQQWVEVFTLLFPS